MNRSERRRAGPAAAAKPVDRRRIILCVTLAVIALLIVAGIFWGSRTPQVASQAPDIAQIKVPESAKNQIMCPGLAGNSESN